MKSIPLLLAFSICCVFFVSLFLFSFLFLSYHHQIIAHALTKRRKHSEKSTTNMGTIEQTVVHLATRISKEVLDHPSTPSSDACLDLLGELKQVKITMVLLEKTKIGKIFVKFTKAINRHKRTETGIEELKKWERSLDLSTELLEKWKKIADKEAKSKVSTAASKKVLQEDKKLPGLPKNATEYRNRLVTQNKQMYKDPPVCPPGTIIIESEKCPLPKRNKTTGELSFVAGGEDSNIQALLKDFHPNRSPEGKIIK
jgi:hypothetical protein